MVVQLSKGCTVYTDASQTSFGRADPIYDNGVGAARREFNGDAGQMTMEYTQGFTIK